MKALVWHGKHDVRCETCPIPKIEDGRDAIIKVTPAPSAAPTCISTTASCPTWRRATCSATRPWARSSRSAPGSRSSRSATASSCRSPSAAASAFCRRGMFSACERTNPDAELADEDVGPFAGRPVRLLAPARRLCRRPGRISARALRRCRRRSRSRTACTDEQALFLSDIFPTGCMAADAMRHRAGRHGRGLGLRAGRPVRHPQSRVPARRGAGHRHRPRARAAGHGRAAGARRSTSTRRRLSTRLNELTQRQGPGDVHRRGRAGGHATCAV